MAIRLDETLKPGQWAWDRDVLPTDFLDAMQSTPVVTVVAGDLRTAKENFHTAMRKRGVYFRGPVPDPTRYRPTTPRKAARDGSDR